MEGISNFLHYKRSLRIYKNKIQSHSSLLLFKKWAKLILITGSGQIIVQATGLVSGLLVIRLLPTNEYALYTLTNTMLGTMTLLADGGISSGVMAQGGKVWQDKEKLGSVLETGLDLRKKFAVGSLLFAIPILCYLLIHHGASPLITTLIVLSLIPAYFATLSDSLLETVPKLHQNIRPLQKNQIITSVGRLLLTGVTIFIFPWTFAILLVNGITRIYGNLQLKKIALQSLEERRETDPQVRKEILVFVRRTMPIIIYHLLSGQLTIWVISIFGKTQAIAEFGALSRFTLIFSFCSIIINTLIVPRFARLPENKTALFRYFSIIQITMLIFIGFIYLTTWTFTRQILWVLGTEYTNLIPELRLIMIVNCIGFVVANCSDIIRSRGWVIKPFLMILINIITLVGSTYYFDFSTIRGIFYYNIMAVSTNYVVIFIFVLLSISRINK